MTVYYHKSFLKMGKVDTIGNAQNLMPIVEKCERWISEFHGASEDREDFIKNTIKHFRTAMPDYNVCVLNNRWPHNVTINDGVHMHVEIPRAVCGTHGFDVYVFKSGVITRHGDGGWINWGFAGNFKRDDNLVQFFEP